MEKITISIVNTVGSSFCVEAEDGQKVFELIKKALGEKKKISLSFLNVEMLTTAFLNTAIGQLYNVFSEEEIKSSLSLEHLTPSGAVSLKRVVETAKLYYKNPDAMQDSINEILGV
jgi:hypothetical protein